MIDWSTYELAAIALGSKTLTFLIAAISIHFMMVLYDRTDAVKTKRAFDTIERDPRALGMYYGLRALAFAVLAGFVYG